MKSCKLGDIFVSDFEDNAGELFKGANNTSVDVTYKRKESATGNQTYERSDLK